MGGEITATDGDREELVRILTQRATTVEPAPGRVIRVVDEATIRRLAPGPRVGPAAKRGLELVALEAGFCPRRYLRNLGTLGLDGQIRLLGTRVGIAGLGGLGGLVAELLARAGVGELVLVDPDEISEDNLNRQLLATEDNLGRSKTEAARRRLRQVNSAVSVSVHRETGEAESFTRLFVGAAVLVDALDTPAARFELEAAARRLGAPMVHGAIAGLAGQVSTIFPGDVGLAAIYGRHEDVLRRGPKTREETRLGNFTATPAMIAALQVQETVKVITGVGQPLRNQLLVLDAMFPYASVIELQPGRARAEPDLVPDEPN